MIEMQGITRVVIFCTLTVLLPILLVVVPLYLRHSLYASVVYTVAESDIMEIDDGLSTIFCSEHTLKMDRPFHAFQVSQHPEVTSYRKHVRLKKSMTLPDDTLEYWGFYLLKGATVALSVCSRFQGASILVVKGESSLRTCGLTQHNENKKPLKGSASKQQVQVTFQSNAQVINSNELEEPRNENQRLYNELNVLENQDGARPRAKNHLLNSTRSNSKDSFNTMDHDLDLLHMAAVNHIQKHTVGENGTLRGVERLRHIRKRLQKLGSQGENNTGIENQETEDQERRRPTKSDAKTGTERLSKRSVAQKSPLDRERSIRLLESVLNSDLEVPWDSDEDETVNTRAKRSQNGITPPVLLDRGIEHGGNALNFSALDKDSSMSSFENGLLTCYDGQVLLAQQFEPSDLCTNISFLVNSKRIQTKHNIEESGYYYYIFYSDNDLVSNDMHAIFDIYKPTLQYENLTRSCINKTECSFSIDFLSPDRVIVEVPTMNGIDDAKDDISLLTSTCHPRMGVYSIFPIAILLLILGCAFL